MTKSKRPSEVLMRPEPEPGPDKVLEKPDRRVIADAPARKTDRSPTAASRIFQLKVTLRGIKPPIWRRLLVVANTSLFDLHQILQVAMGWSDSHLHAFQHAGELFGESDLDWGVIRRTELKTKVGALLDRSLKALQRRLRE